MYTRKNLVLAGMVLLLLGASTGFAQKATDDTLRSGFENPPESARPRVWWHWMNGNITKEGIKLDLDWMHRIGLGGFQNFDAAIDTPQVVQHRLVYMTPEWKDAFRYATQYADRLGLEEAIAGSPGWSETGGPWVPASEGMKKYVWSELRVEGGKPFSGVLPHPPSATGPFQNSGEGAQSSEHYYADSAVVAYKIPADDVPLESLHPVITTSAGNADAALLMDGDLNKSIHFAKSEGTSWIQYAFPNRVTIRALSIVAGWDGRSEDLGATLEASDDGQTFHFVADLPKYGAAERTIAFAPVTAAYYRVAFKKLSPIEIHVAELALHTGAYVNRFEEKAAFTPAPDLYPFATAPIAPADAIQKDDVVDLTGRMQPDGRLDWTPPAGEWMILRFGYSLLGITNHPATKEATGLEVDKLNAGYVKHYMDGYLDSYAKTVGPAYMGSRGIRYVITDSWEAGAQNWTDKMVEEFAKRRGYDPHPWLPVLAGHVVESAAASDQFLWDFRKTIADLTADEHYGQVEASLKARGMGHYGESHEGGRAFIADGMEVKKLDDIPMGAMWTQRPGVNKETYDFNADDRESASVAHIYGQNLAAAESMTAWEAPWAWSPASLKPTADQEFLNGINRFVIHESAHQPLVDKAPGLTLGPFGQWFNRNDTWAEEAGPWVDYLARTSFLLQQGRFEADLAYFYGEDSNLTAIFTDKAPNIPQGYNFDYINADGLIHEFSVSNGRITTKSGMSYKLLGLDPYSRHMSLPVLKAIYKLVEDGATVAGPKPVDDPSLADDQAEFAKLNNELFGDGTGVHKVGKGIVYAGEDLGEVFQQVNLEPDFECNRAETDTDIRFVHRRLKDGDLYFVDNRNNRDETVNARFRVTERAPELWHADTGRIEPASFTIANGRTTVPLHLEPWGSVFVVFRKAETETSRTLPQLKETSLTTLSGPWKIDFQAGRGAPSSITLDRLISWSDSTDAGVKYFSGAGTYTKEIQAPASWFKKGAHIWIDLGEVANLASVTFNGKSLGTVWHAPYRVDVTNVLKPGANTMTVKVTNAWVNRLIGDQQPGAKKYTFADVTPYKADAPLLPSGLLGPVKVLATAAEQ